MLYADGLRLFDGADEFGPIAFGVLALCGLGALDDPGVVGVALEFRIAQQEAEFGDLAGEAEVGGGLPPNFMENNPPKPSPGLSSIARPSKRKNNHRGPKRLETQHESHSEKQKR